MMLKRGALLVSMFIAIVMLIIGCGKKKQCQTILGSPVGYDMRKELSPSRLTIAMWDNSWLNMHHPAGVYEDWNKVLDELTARGFNTIRIETFPIIVAEMKTSGEKTRMFGKNPYDNWGFSTIDYPHNVPDELVEFLTAVKNKKLHVILSSWGAGNQAKYADRQTFWQAWEVTLDMLKEHNLLDIVMYVDLDQEFPYFSPMMAHLNELSKEKVVMESQLDAMEAAGRRDWAWNSAQMAFVKDYMTSSLNHFQKRYPSVRFTFSLTSFWKEVRAMKVPVDVLEVHTWLNLTQLGVRTSFDPMAKDRNPANDYKAYMQQIRDMLHAKRPMLMKDMENQLKFASEWSQEIAAPVVITEAWGPWWHMDHPDLEWQWLFDWCDQCSEMSCQFPIWGITPWNYSHPYWKNWTNIKWYQKINRRFLDS
ncbi:MAG TPA: cellulase-like family protein [Methylococcales bacterium]